MALWLVQVFPEKDAAHTAWQMLLALLLGREVHFLFFVTAVCDEAWFQQYMLDANPTAVRTYWLCVLTTC